MMAGVLAVAPGLAVAQVDATKFYTVNASSLEEALNSFARQAGITLSFDPALVRGQASAALDGDYSVRDGLRALLRPHRLEAVLDAGGSWTLRRLPAGADAATTMLLEAVKVQADAGRDSTTESSGAYKAAQTRSATGLDLSPRETPQSVTVMTHDRIRDQGLSSIGEVMDQVVGIEGNSTSSLGSDGTAYYARGFQIQNFQVDGMPRPAGVYGFAEETADMLAYDRVEIVRGASGLMTGQGLPSATINLVRKHATAQPQLTFAAETGSWNHYRVEGDIGGPLTDRVRGRLAAAYQQNDSFIDREHAERKLAYGVIDADLSSTTQVSAGLEYQDFNNHDVSRGGVPLLFTDGTPTDFSRSTNSGANWTHANKDSFNVFASLQQQLGEDWRLRVDAEHKDGAYDETIGYIYAGALDRDTGAGGTLYVARWARDQQLDGVNANLQGNFRWLGREHQASLSLSHATSKEKGADTPGWWSGPDYAAAVDDAFAFYASGVAPMPDLSDTDTSAGRKVEESALSGVVRLKPLDPLAVIIGSRITKWQDQTWSRSETGEKTTTPGAEESGVWTPYAGLVFDLNRTLSVYASYTSIFQPQTQKDVSGKTLDPLEGNSTEAGLKAEALGGKLDASAALFRMKQDNYAVPVGAGIYAPDGSLAYRAASGATAEGFELEVAGEPLPGWRLAGGYTHVNAEDAEGKSLNPNIAKDSFKLFSTYQLHGGFKDLRVGGNLRWQGKTRVIDAGGSYDQLYRQEALVIADLLAHYALTPRAALNLNVHNVFDKTWYSGLSGGSARYGEPRSFSLSLRYELF